MEIVVKQRNQQQCRSHGQKYLESLAKLLILVTKKSGQLKLDKQEFAKVKSYEEVYISLLKSLKGEDHHKVKLQFIPRYLQDKLKNPG